MRPMRTNEKKGVYPYTNPKSMVCRMVSFPPTQGYDQTVVGRYEPKDGTNTVERAVCPMLKVTELRNDHMLMRKVKDSQPPELGVTGLKQCAPISS